MSRPVPVHEILLLWRRNGLAAGADLVYVAAAGPGVPGRHVPRIRSVRLWEKGGAGAGLYRTTESDSGRILTAPPVASCAAKEAAC